MGYCTKCEKSFSDNSKFCGECGTPFRQNLLKENEQLPEASTRNDTSGRVATSHFTILPYQLEKWTKALYIFMGLWLLTTFVTMIYSFSAANEFDKPRRWDEKESLMQNGQNWAEWANGLWIVSGIIFLCFLWRATKNLISAGIATRRGAGWSVGGWFIPIGWFWIPYQTVRELIETRPNASDPYGPDVKTRMTERNANCWLGIWIVSLGVRFSGYFLVPTIENAETLEDFGRIYNYIGFIYLIETALIIAYFFVVKSISERQED